MAGANVQRHQLHCRLCASLLGDALTLLAAPAGDMRGPFFLSHLLYTIWFASQMTMSFFCHAAAGAVGYRALLLCGHLEPAGRPAHAGLHLYRWRPWLWSGWPVSWFRPTDTAFSGFAGATSLLLSNIVWLISHYRRRFRADNAIAAAFYFAGHF
ncbi:hypothetical protein DMH17_08290 [Raoultella planticola]|nr:hypothetical protein [Raoultella planticola]